MKKLPVFIFLATLSTGALAGDLDIGTHANFYLPPGGGSNTLMTGIDASYRMNDRFSAKGSADTSNYTTDTAKFEVTMLSLDLIYHALGASAIDPYFGAGAGLTDTKTDDGTTRSDITTTSYNAVAGISANLQSLNVGVEIKYIIPDSRHMETGFYSVGGNLAGGMHISF